MIERRLPLIQPQVCLLFLRPVALEAVTTKDRKDVAGEVGSRIGNGANVDGAQEE